MSIEVLLHFLKLDIQTSTLDLKGWIDRLYTSNDLRRLFPDRAAAIRLEIERKDAASGAPHKRLTNGVFAETNLCGAQCFYVDGRFVSSNHGDFWHEIEYDLATKTILASVGGKYGDSGHAVVSNMIRPILQSFILPFSGLKTIHGAVLTKNGRTIFLSGSGGMGKTTTALQLMRAGYHILSDDGPFFFSDGRKAYALASLDYVHFTADTLSLFPELLPHIVGLKDSRDKFAARISDVQTNNSWAKPYEVTDYVQLRRKQGLVTPGIRKISRNVVHRQLLDESMVIFRRSVFRGPASPFLAYSEFVFDLLMKLVQGAETYELEFSDHHLPEIPLLIDQL